ncbi:MAG: anthranilate synthase component I family protein [Cytophagaceae bacterium]|nr:anthranilate synthase component I family protein [Cytophagaceae bacterium]MDW8457183.1 anthranilate synthase component I family protein [Cytophagaceae bacterium]
MTHQGLFNSDDYIYKKALRWASMHEVCCAFRNHNIDYPYGAFPNVIACGVEKAIERFDTLNDLDHFLKQANKKAYGFFSYELKNRIEKLHSKNIYRIPMPELYFFIPKHLIHFYDGAMMVESTVAAERVYEEILSTGLPEKINISKPDIRCSVNKDEYLYTVEKIKEHIYKGDVYEMNYCIEFFAQDVFVDALHIYQNLCDLSPMPFSCFFKLYEKYLLGASPERFLKKTGKKIISQPIKGTARRSGDRDLDIFLKQHLEKSTKDRSENIMITDLVRNDLSKNAVPGSVRVEELCKVYTFHTVHQMISTITAEVAVQTSVSEMIMNTFPMGSMTGAPKIKAMELIDLYENTCRGLYSGTVGFIEPDGNFDFSVVIRSIVYDHHQGIASFHAGSAITSLSDPAGEYEECLLKAEAMRRVFS